MRAVRALYPVLVALTLCHLPSTAQAQVFVRITVAPPLLPVYVQPAIPGPDYIWAPGYWAWGPGDYYWVPGTWVLAPAPGLLWTPGHWGWSDGIYVWRAGYWGPRVGFYGGINYGYGYTGVGYQGGYWNGRVFMYNTAVVNVGTVHITNVYSKTVINSTTVTNVSFNGGKGGVVAQANAQELAAAGDKHVPATALQTQHEHAASSNHSLLASVNHGHPAIAATAVAAHLAGAGIVAAKGYNAAAKSLAPKQPGPKQPGQFHAAKMVGQPGPKGPPRQVKRPDHSKKQP
jgi:WXXGXW repeat (2 copies)